jgi:cyclohexa-1,5-dienecarbonyl-CoA hydratase
MPQVNRISEAPGAWLRLVVNAPPGNVLSMHLIAELRAALAAAGSESGLKLITIEGAGDDFSYGASVSEHLPPLVHQMLPAFHGLIRDLLDAPAPTMAVVRGRCLGGGFEVALACDFIVAADEARLGVPEVTLGVFPPAASALLPVRVGGARTARAVIAGEVLPASWWADAGLVSHVSTTERLETDVRASFERHFAARSAVALRHAARAARTSLRDAVLQSLAALERQYLDHLVLTHDAVEGCTAFLQKRPPAWEDR